MCYFSLIQKTKGVCGGNARIRNTCIPIWIIVWLLKQEIAEEEILSNFPGLISQDLYIAWMYYQEHTKEIDKLIRHEDK